MQTVLYLYSICYLLDNYESWGEEGRLPCSPDQRNLTMFVFALLISCVGRTARRKAAGNLAEVAAGIILMLFRTLSGDQDCKCMIPN